MSSLGFEFEPVVGRATVADTVYQNLRRALIVGRFEPGQMMTIAALAKMFQTSQMPVREALRRLGAEGALEARPNGSSYVPKVSRTRLDDICRARVALETLATELAVLHITDDEIDALVRLEADHAATTDRQDVYQMLQKNRDFHFAIYNAARSDVLPALIDSLWLRYGPYMRVLSEEVERDMKEHEPFLRGHRAIIDAIIARDKDRAMAELEKDIVLTQTLLQGIYPH